MGDLSRDYGIHSIRNYSILIIIAKHVHTYRTVSCHLNLLQPNDATVHISSVVWTSCVSNCNHWKL